MPKLLVIIGITGNQGGSVASTFLSDPAWRIRGLTRDPDSAASRALSDRGVEMLKADLHDPESLKTVFKGANLIFSVTDFWAPFFNPANHARAKKQGKSIGQYAYELEREQGINIADAVAREVEGLDDVGFVASTLCNAKEASGGKYTELWHFDGKAEVFPGYLERMCPELAWKTSYLHTGYFFTSWRFTPERWFAKVCCVTAAELNGERNVDCRLDARWICPNAIPNIAKNNRAASQCPQRHRSIRTRLAHPAAKFNSHGGERVAHVA
jgi:hypothetical protein